VREAIIAAIIRRPWLAHSTLFRHRHPSTTPAFHEEIVQLWHAPAHPRVIIQAFRGAAKSTLAEEAIIIAACLRRYKNIIILGETWERACERLRSIRHEIESNQALSELFGSQVGPTWAESKLVLANGTIVQAFGRGQSLRGSKHLDSRPDCAFCDDIENEESTSSIEQIEKTKQWLMAVVIPALEPTHTIRINGTPLHPRSLICTLASDPGWESRVYPVEHISSFGQRVSSWPDRFPLEKIDELRANYARLGLGTSFTQEYLCQAEDPANKVFVSSFIRVETTVRTWQPVYAMCDPARSTTRNSAMTGMAIWSWMGNRLLVWDAYGGFWKPDEIVSRLFQIDDEYSPVAIGVERDGLEEFILQPLRHEQLRRGRPIPIRPLRAPRGKLAFISGLQPWFKAGEVIFAKPCPDAFSQLLNFPSGLIDIPNALAYAGSMRPGSPIYDQFSTTHVEDDLPADPHRPFWLAVNTDGRSTTGLLLQFIDGSLHLLADRVREGEPSACFAEIVQDLTLEAGTRRLRLLVSPVHYVSHAQHGLLAAIRALPAAATRGGEPAEGRTVLTRLLASLAHGRPALQVASTSRWALNALSGGYARAVDPRSGVLTAEAVEGPYRVLMEGLESFCALAMQAHLQEDELPVSYETTSDGRRYISSRVVNR
jgi:hypothetical protein